MNDANTDFGYDKLERHREYLKFLACQQLDRRLQAKVDLSGVVQQTLLEAHKALPEMIGEDSATRLAWMRRILANNLADEVRKVTTQKHDAFREQSLVDALDQSSVRLEGWLAADVSSPSQSLQRDERASQLSAALSKLQPAEREAIMLKNWENKTLAEIAKQMDRTPAAVAGLLKRGLRKLREEFLRSRE